MKLKYTPELIAEVLSLKQSLTIHQIAVRLNLPVGTVGTIIHRSEWKPAKKPKPEKPTKTERRELNVEQKIKQNGAKQQRAQERFNNTQIGDRITVFYPGERVSGEVVAKYPKTLSIVNDEHRRATIMLVDILNYRVVGI